MPNIPPVPNMRNLEEFRRWLSRYLVPSVASGSDLSALESTVTTQTGLINTNTSGVAANATNIAANAAAIATNATGIASNVTGIAANLALITALQGMAHLRADLTAKAIANATWEIVAITPTSSALCDFADPEFTLLAGEYDIDVTSVFTGPSDIDFGVTYDGGSGWTTLATSITSPETITGVTLSPSAQFGFYANTGSGTLDSGSVAITRA